MWGTQAEYAALRAHEKPNEPLHKVFMVLGPWNHGGWSCGPGDKLGGKFGTITFGGEKTGAYYRAHFEAPFFEFYLKGKPGFDLKDTASFRTGENQWHTYAIWPPKVGFHEERAYLQPDETLSFVAPKGLYDVKAAAYVADPADPIPYRHRPIQSTYGEGSTWRTWLVEDQRFVSGRKDLANFETPVLTERCDGDRRCGGGSLRSDDRHGCGLDCEADRCVSGGSGGRDVAGDGRGFHG